MPPPDQRSLYVCARRLIPRNEGALELLHARSLISLGENSVFAQRNLQRTPGVVLAECSRSDYALLTDAHRCDRCEATCRVF